MNRALHSHPGRPDWPTIIAQAQLCFLGSAAEARLLSDALHLAARHDKVEVAGLVLARGAGTAPLESDADFPRTSPMYECAGWRRGSVGVAALLLARGADVGGEEGAKVMKAAVRHGHMELLRMVACAAGADAKGAVGETALHYAAKRGDLEAGEVLVRCGADVGVRTDLGLDVEAVARKHERAEFIEWMYLSRLVVPPPSSNPIVKRCHAMEGFGRWESSF